MEKRFTPDNITGLQENEIFVFGSNLKGAHAGGAAATAVKMFGAKNGVAVGLQGQSYAIPTLDENFKKLDLKTIKGHLWDLAVFAKDNAQLSFFLTKIGCGIAGFSEKEIADTVYAANLPDNVIIPEDFQILETFKGFDKDLKCRDFQYEIGKSYTQDTPAELCGTGFHSCEHPLDVLSFYPVKNGNRYCTVRNLGKVAKSKDGDTKIASKTIEVSAELGLPGLLKASVKYVRSYIKDATTGNKAHSATTGNYAHSATTGDEAHSATTGKNSIAAGLGVKSKAKAALGSWIVLSEWKQDANYNWQLECVKTAMIDGEALLPDTFYSLENGEFVKSEE